MGFLIVVRGGGEEAVAAMEGDLLARGAAVEALTPARQPGMPESAIPASAAMLAKHGVIVLLSSDPSCPGVPVEVIQGESALDAEARSTFLRRLELAGRIPAASGELEPGEEEMVRERLQKLGYL